MSGACCSQPKASTAPVRLYVAIDSQLHGVGAGGAESAFACVGAAMAATRAPVRIQGRLAIVTIF
jgi:hypothetical protein